MRVLVVSHAAMLAVNQEPFDALARAGAEVAVVVPRRLRTDIRGRVAWEALPGFAGRLIPLAVPFGGYNPLMGGQRGIHLILYAGLEREIERARPDVLFVEEEPHSLAARQVASAARERGIPFVVHENQNIFRRLPLPFPRIRRFVLRAAAGVTVRNSSAADAVRAEGFTGPIATFPHGVDLDRFRGGAPQAGLEPPVVGFVGRLVPEKGILDLVEAVGMMRGRLGRGSLLVIGDGPLAGEARRRAGATGVPALFIGALAHEAVPGRYGAMDVVAIPSRTTVTWKEQFGRIVIEANAAAVPVVTSDSGELPATVAATEGGIVVPEGDIGALAGALASLCEDDEHRRALGAAGRAGVEARFTHDAIARDLFALLKESTA